MGVVVTSGFACNLRRGETTKFATPDHECVLEQSAFLQICE